MYFKIPIKYKVFGNVVFNKHPIVLILAFQREYYTQSIFQICFDVVIRQMLLICHNY